MYQIGCEGPDTCCWKYYIWTNQTAKEVERYVVYPPVPEGDQDISTYNGMGSSSQCGKTAPAPSKISSVMLKHCCNSSLEVICCYYHLCSKVTPKVHPSRFNGNLAQQYKFRGKESAHKGLYSFLFSLCWFYPCQAQVVHIPSLSPMLVS
ncbi:hypothetical protein E2C01_029391 [Portunus trituberculatus]|uniref:Uncharacterized protein n=1 Tax=Portunus trituberculatus TaxID=210409 RepID=A0A5B7ENC1_PORTR|nr:hypothetical protein [Portunus trituberculatus]